MRVRGLGLLEVLEEKEFTGRIYRWVRQKEDTAIVYKEGKNWHLFTSWHDYRTTEREWALV